MRWQRNCVSGHERNETERTSKSKWKENNDSNTDKVKERKMGIYKRLELQRHSY